MFFKQLLHSSTVRLALIALVLCSISLIGERSTEVALAAPEASSSSVIQQVNNVPDVVNQPSATKRHYCNVFEVSTGFGAAGNDVVNVGCSPSDGPYVWFAISATDAKRPARVLSIALTAKATGQHIFIDYDPNNTTNIPCDPAMCREITGIGLREP